MTLRDRITRYLKKQDTWVPKRTILRLVAQHTHHNPDYAGRELRKLREEKIIERKLVRGAAQYRMPQIDVRLIAAQQVAWFDQLGITHLQNQ